ncbi:MAG: 4Fe-4S dicluster domain-containing protein [bacterium]|nr:4Fe-4S dicluster domain-containing protein [bacterium]
MDNYEQLQEILDSHPAGAPKSKAFDEILKILYTPEEVALAIHMSFKAKSIEYIAEASSLSPEEAEKILESMAAKAVIISRDKDSGREYALLPTIPGVFEFPFMKGGGTPMHDKLGKLWEEYHHEGMGAAFAGNPTSQMRVVPVEKSLDSQTQVHPYEEVASLIERSDYIALTECACRVSVKGCDAPTDVCLVFSFTGKFLVERGYAREINKKEAMEVLDRSEENGLVHTSNNSADKAGVICNCCSCCCTVLRGKTQLNHPHAFSTSRFEALVESDGCTNCGVCYEDRCPVKAIEVKDDAAFVDTKNCIGCGLCVSTCPTEAIKMIERENIPEIPASIKEMGIKVLQEKGKLDKFMKIMSK